MAIWIVTDSTADLPEKDAKDLNITVVPLNVHFGEETYLDWVELKPEAFYERLRKTEDLPRTSQPSPGDFAKVYEELGGPEDTVISMHISAALSGTYQSATMARDMVEKKDIEVIDTKVTSMGLGLIVMKAAKAVQEGKNKEEVLEIIHYYMQESQIFFLVDTLEYLQKNGRIGKAAAFLGGLLNVKPILSLKDGHIVPVEKVRGSKKAMVRMVEILQERIPAEKKIVGAIVHGSAPDKAAALAGELEKAYESPEVIVTSVGAVIGCHTGPGLVGLLFAPVKE